MSLERISLNTNTYPINISNKNVNFQSRTVTKLENSPKQDAVEISSSKKKKKKMPILAKIGIGMLVGATTIITCAVLVSRHKTNELKKLYQNKLKISNLPENIEFKEATTVEEAINFAKNTLNIKTVDDNFSLEAINMTNKGLVDVSNANKGKCFMPTALRYKRTKEEYLAAVMQDIKADDFGELVVNPKFFEPKELEKHIKKALYTENGEQVYRKVINSNYVAKYSLDNIIPLPSNELTKLIDKFYTDPRSLNLSDMKLLAHSLNENNAKLSFYQNAPISFLKDLESKQIYQDALKNLNIKINYEELNKKTQEEQVNYVKDLLKKLIDNKTPFTEKYIIYKPETTIYHEMGHLQDFAKNLKNLDIEQNSFNLKQLWQDAKEEVRTGKKKSNPALARRVDNRWGGITYEGYEKLLKTKPEEFKQYYPDLYEFLTNKEIQETAGKVSRYSQTSIGEFIAETYIKIIKKEPIPEDVMKLYKKYNGPLLPD